MNYFPTPRASGFAESFIHIDNEYGERDIPVYHTGNSSENCDVLVIPPLVGGIDIRSRFILQKCHDIGRSCVIFGYSDLHAVEKGSVVENFSILRCADDAHAIFDVYKPNGIIGGSFSSSISLKLTSENRLKWLLLAAPGTSIKAHFLDAFLGDRESKHRKFFEEMGYYDLAIPFYVPDASSRKYLRKIRIRREDIEATERCEIFRSATEIEVTNATILHDPRDPHIAYKASEELRNKIRTAESPDSEHPFRPRLIPVEGAGHDFANKEEVIWQHACQFLGMSGMS